MSRLGWSMLVSHPQAGEMVLPIDDQALAYEAAPIVHGLCSMLGPCSARVSVVEACAVPPEPTVELAVTPSLFDEEAP